MKTQRPTITERAADRTCPECGGPAERRSARGPVPTFCSQDCRKAHGNRHMVEGRAVIAFLKAWRIDRGGGEIAKGSLAEVCAIVDSFNTADREAGRPRADLYAAKLLAGDTRYMDRQKRR